MIFRASKIHGLKIAATDEEVGHANDLLFDDHKWTIRYLTVDTGGWLSGRQVLLSPVVVQEIGDHVVRVDLLRQQVEDSPDISVDEPVSRQQEMAVTTYYGWPMYWNGAGIWGGPVGAGIYPLPALIPAAVDAPSRDEDEAVHGDPNLRSAREVTGYGIAASDGDSGHVSDLLIDPNTWAVRYIAVDTGSWLPGRKVLVPPQWIKNISWIDSVVSVDLDQDTIRSAPQWDPNEPLDRAYEASLFRHFDRTPYWENESLMDRWQTPVA